MYVRNHACARSNSARPVARSSLVSRSSRKTDKPGHSDVFVFHTATLSGRGLRNADNPAQQSQLLARSRSSAEARSRAPGSKPLFGSKPYTWLEAALGSKPLFDSTPKTWPGAALRLAPGRRSNSASMLFMPHPLCGAEGGSRLPGILHGARLVVGSAEVDVFWCGQRCNKTPSHSGPVRMLARQHQSRNIH